MRHFTQTDMKLIHSTLIFLTLISCNSTDNKTSAEKNLLPNDSTSVADNIQKQIDTSTLHGKREIILNKFMTEGEIQRHPDFDTLIDLTYDNNKDYVIGYYGSTGSGIKNRIEVFLFNKQTNSYYFDSLLSDMANPTFYLDKKKITNFYIGNGGGGGSRLEWINNKWTPTKTFTVDKQDTVALWTITYPLENRSVKKTRTFQMVPPDDILETEIKE